MIADFRQYYSGLDLADIFKDGGLSTKTALHLVYQLPEESRFVGMMRGGSEFIGWTTSRYLETAQVDLLNALLYAFIQSKSKRKRPEPTPVAVPDKKSQRENPFEKQLALQFDRLRS